MKIEKVEDTLICVFRDCGSRIYRTTMIDTEENRKSLKRWIERYKELKSIK